MDTKYLLQKLKKGEHIFRYGQIIGISSKEIHPGQHVHSHNLTFSEFNRNYDNHFSARLTSLKKIWCLFSWI